MRSTLFVLFVLPFVVAGLPGQNAAAAKLPELTPPSKVEADGKPIEVVVGHAAPFVLDFDGDGTMDLAVGQYGGGTCRLYRNLGTNAERRFGAFELLQSDGKPASMESG